MIAPGLHGALHVSGCTSDAGKSTVVVGLCRLLARNGVSVAPFKAQNMALNSFVTRTGDEIGRAQGAQALAAGLEPTAAMNPILLKPTGERTSQVVVMGKPIGVMTAAEYHEHKPVIRAMVLEALAGLRGEFDVVLCEGAGSPTEINLLAHDIVNLSIARDAGMRSVVVGDIDRGGVFAHLYGTVALLPEDLRATVGGFLINRFRGDPALLGDGMAQLEAACGVPTLGVLPVLAGMWLDGEDSVALGVPIPSAGPALADSLEVVAIRLPQLSNYTDLDALALEPGVSVRYVDDAASIGRPDLVVIPGSKETVADLTWLRAQGIDAAITASGADVLGICAGYQLLGDAITDEVESHSGAVTGLGWLPGVTTEFGAAKVLRQHDGARAGGYQIHHGRVSGPDGAGWVPLDDGDEGTVRDDGRVRGTTLHGLFEHDAFRTTFLTDLADRRGKRFAPAGVAFAAARQARFDTIADAIETHTDLDALTTLIGQVRA